MPAASSLSSVYALVYVEQGLWRLYAELIQVIAPRQRSWVRPLCLCEYTSLPSNDGLPTLRQFHDVRGGADLVWPSHLFIHAIDTELLPVLAKLPPETPALGTRLTPTSPQEQVAKQKLRQFLEKICSMNQVDDVNKVSGGDAG